MNPIAFLRTKDNTERILMQAIAYEVRELQRQLDLDRASMIANAVGQLFKG
jgi:hypothetical protein